MGNELKEVNFTLGIIIPCYNVEKYIEQCVESLLNNLPLDVLLIFVNDCSTDGTSRILERFSNYLSNIEVIQTPKNIGLSGARNFGIKHLGSRSAYIGFIDSDDFVVPNFYEEIIDIINLYVPDIIEYNCFNYKPNEREIRDIVPIGREGLNMYDSEYIIDLFDRGQMFVHCRIFKYNIIKNIEFPLGKRYEDTFYTPLAYSKSKTIFSTSKVLLNYRVNDSGITKNPRASDVGDFFDSWDFNSLNFIDKEIKKPMDKFYVLLIIAFSKHFGLKFSFQSLQKILKKLGFSGVSIILSVIKSKIFKGESNNR